MEFFFDFTIYCWVEFNVSLTTKSDIAMGANKALSAAGIAAPLYIQKIRIDRDNDLHPKDWPWFIITDDTLTYIGQHVYILYTVI